MIERIPPHSKDAEQALLGAMIMDEAAISVAHEIIRTAESFYVPSHRSIYAAIMALFEKSMPADITTVAEELERRDELQKAGGRTYLVDLASGVATTANVAQYAGIVREKHKLRDCIAIAAELARDAYDAADDGPDIIDRAEQRLFELSTSDKMGEWVRFSDAIPGILEDIQKKYDAGGGLVGLPTGYRDLDALTGGLKQGELIIVAGRPSCGKSALATGIGENVCRKTGCGVAIFSLEMSTTGIIRRAMCGNIRVNPFNAEQGRIDPEAWPRFGEVGSHYHDLNLFVNDVSGITPTDVRSRLRKIASKYDIGLVIIDYLQLMETERRVENRQQEITVISRRLKGLAKEFNIPVMALSQLSRAVESREHKRPQLSDLRESGAIEQDADIVIFIYRPEQYLQHLREDDDERKSVSGMAEIIVSKNRNGPTGNLKLTFIKDLVRFEDYSRRDYGGAF